MKLNEINDRKGARTHRTRRGRGSSSGLGKTSGHGVKGQHARAGVAVNGFEGGQMPLYMRLPKRGFFNHFGTDFAVVNLGRIQAAVDAGKIDVAKTITGAILAEASLVSHSHGRDGVRLLAKGELKTSSISRWRALRAPPSRRSKSRGLGQDHLQEDRSHEQEGPARKAGPAANRCRQETRRQLVFFALSPEKGVRPLPYCQGGRLLGPFSLKALYT